MANATGQALKARQLLEVAASASDAGALIVGAQALLRQALAPKLTVVEPHREAEAAGA